MMRVWRAASVFLLIPGILLAPASRFLSAATPWESIPYNQWTEADARKLLQDSPWVKTISIQGESDDVWLPLIQYRMETSSTSEPDCSCGGSDALMASIPTFSALDERFPDYSGIKVKVLLLSSLRIRQALARLSQMRGDVPTMSEDMSLEQRPDHFIIAITGPDLSLFLGSSLDSLKDSTRLKSKKNSRKTLELSNVGLPSESLK